MIYIMNSAVMPAGCFGTYTYRPSCIEVLKNILEGRYGMWESAIGYPQNVNLIHKWTGIRIPMNRTNTILRDGDHIFVMRLVHRVSDPSVKGCPVSEDLEDWEFAHVAYTA